MIERAAVQISATTSSSGYAMLTMSGTLDSATYREIRDSVIKSAIDEPTAVLVDVTALHAPAESAWSAFTSARWHVSTWPDVPVVLICGSAARRSAITRSGVTRYVPLHADLMDAQRSIGNRHDLRKRATAALPADRSSLTSARSLTAQWLEQWHRHELILTASTVAIVFVENVLEHTSSPPNLVVEAMRDIVTVAVSDESHLLAERHEDSQAGARALSGLAIVSALSRAWGCSPTASGKTVWAVLGPENQL